MKKFYEIKQYGNKAEIRIYGDITSETLENEDTSASSFGKELSAIGDIQHVDIYFNSPGGSVFEGIAIYHQIKRHPAHFTGYVDGLAASIASVILMACDEIVMPSNAYLMIHNPYMGVIGNQNELRKRADDLERIRESSINAYLEKAKKKLSREQIIEIMDNETWLLGSEALEIGLCDKLEKPVELVASVENKEILSRYSKAPRILIDEVGQQERQKIINQIQLEKAGKKMKPFEFTEEEKVMRAKKLQDNVVLASLKKNGTNSSIDYHVEQGIKQEIALSIIKGKKTYNQALLATTGESQTDGNMFVGKTNQADVVTERLAYNPLLDYITLTNQKNLDDVPKLIFSIDDDELIADGQIAKELELEGTTVNFTRYKSKIYADMTETVESGTNTNLTEKTSQSLAASLSMKEIKLMFGNEVKEEYEHMNFYQAGLQEITGEDVYNSIINSINSLSFFFRANAVVIMKEADFISMRFSLASKGLCKLDSKPEDLFNRPVVFIDLATDPIVGDMRYYQLNYDDTLFDGDKDIKTGVITSVLTTWFDAHILLKNAFRIAKLGNE